MHERSRVSVSTAVWGIAGLFAAAGWLAAGSPARAADPVPQDLLDAQVEGGTVCALVDPYSEPPVVVVGQAASESERYAAEELATHLAKITGRDIAVADDAAVPAGRKVIAVGRSRLTEGYDLASLGVEQYLIDIRADGIAIVGGRLDPVTDAKGRTYARDRGTLYGVYEFLESLGVRWYRPEPWGWHIPRSEAIELPVRMTISDPPDFIGRGAVRVTSQLADPARAQEDQRLTEAWAARQRLNVRTSEDNRYGGTVAFIPNWHSHAVIIPPGKYLADHPEYFALVNGERGNPGSGGRPQLCLGNPELQEAFAARVIQLAKENPQWSLVVVDPEDGTQLGSRMCTCDRCKAMDDPAEPELMSNRVFAFTNLIARKVAAAAPGTRLGLYAYSMHTRVPTLVDRLEPNVVVALANINQWTDWSKEMLDPASPQNARFVELIQAWAGVAPHKLWMREYSAYGWLGPIPMYRLLQERIQAFRQLGMEAFIWGGENHRASQLLLVYLKAQLQWNPDLDVERELDLYYRNYYGPAAEPMRAYYERWMDAFEQSSIATGINGGVSSGGRGMHMLCTPALLAELDGHLDRAAELVRGEPVYERRLAQTRTGHEVSRRIGEILELKLATGEPTPYPRRPTGTYLKSAEAEAAWEEFTRWLAGTNDHELQFQFALKEGKPVITALSYMKRDILENGRFTSWDEKPLLQAQGFGRTAGTARGDAPSHPRAHAR